MIDDILPPEDYRKRELATISLEKGLELFRCYRSKRILSQAIYFAKDTKYDKKISGRFGDNHMQEGVCYFGTTKDTCVVETLLQKNKTIFGVPEADLSATSLISVIFSRKLSLVELYGNGLHKNCADAAITTSSHLESRLWSTQIIVNTNNYDGIIWRSKINDDQLCVVLFERVKDVISHVFGWGKLNSLELRDEVANILYGHDVDIL